MSLLDVSNLAISFDGTAAVDQLSFRLDSGESLGIVGETGSGKTQTALALLGLSPAGAAVRGDILFDGVPIGDAEPAQLNRIRAERIGMVFQDPMQALNPYLRIGQQISRILLEHGLADAAGAEERVVGMLDKVGLPDPERQYRSYPHQLSGGMRQRAMIASALIAEPDLLIADEPTTALDVTVQAQILELLETLRDDTALLLITHDLGIVAGHCERMLVMQHGRLIEEGPTRNLFVSPQHSHTQELINAAPRLGKFESPDTLDSKRIIEAGGVSVNYDKLQAVIDVNLHLRQGETLSLVGESGSGKSSLVRAMLGLVPAEAGKVVFCGVPMSMNASRQAMKDRRDLSLVFQDPVGSLNPQMRVEEIIGETLDIHRPGLSGFDRQSEIISMLKRVGLKDAYRNRFPHELSGGQAQRVAIARAVITRPQVLVCDEAVAALDGSVRQQILDLLMSLQAETGLSIIFISHDLAVVEGISHRIMVMYLGRVVEHAAGRALFSAPRHPYTQALLAAVPEPDPLCERSSALLSGETPSPMAPPMGCPFHTRCPHTVAVCKVKLPVLRDLEGDQVACHRTEELNA